MCPSDLRITRQHQRFEYIASRNARLQLRWNLANAASAGNETENAAAAGLAQRLTASHPTSLQVVAWLLPVARYERPRVLVGEARIDADDLYWRVTAGAVRGLTLQLPLRAAVAMARLPGADLPALRAAPL